MGESLIETIQKSLEMPDGKILGRSGQYAELDGARIYYEIHGEGPPLLLLHGGLDPLETLFAQVRELCPHYTVIIPERRGHGRSPDTFGPFSYPQGVGDMKALLERLGISGVDLVGWSDGAIIALLLAREAPAMAGRVVAISANFHHRGYTQEFLRSLRGATADRYSGENRTLYAATSPDGAEHYPAIFQKLKDLWLTQPTLEARDLQGIRQPVLILAGDGDVVSLEHTVELYRALPDARLGIIPGGAHMLPISRANLVNATILDFLGDKR